MKKDLSNVNTEGYFEFRVKPGIVHAPQVINRSVEEIQKIIVDNKQSAEKYVALIQDLVKRVDALEKKLGEKDGAPVETQDQTPA